jgi:hypothetical protein
MVLTDNVTNTRIRSGVDLPASSFLDFFWIHSILELQPTRSSLPSRHACRIYRAQSSIASVGGYLACRLGREAIRSYTA